MLTMLAGYKPRRQREHIDGSRFNVKQFDDNEEIA
jgi:hypothetical protein